MSERILLFKTIVPTGIPVGTLLFVNQYQINMNYLSAACAAARRAIGTLKGEQDT